MAAQINPKDGQTMAAAAPVDHDSSVSGNSVINESAAVSSEASSVGPATAGDDHKMGWRDRRTTIRLIAAYFSFMVIGLTDGLVGPLLPYIETYYSQSYTNVSFIFLTAAAGYFAAAFTNRPITERLGWRGNAFVAPMARLVSFVIFACHPPFPLIVIAPAIFAFGSSHSEGAWNAYIGNLRPTSILLGILHGFWGVGAVISPLFAGVMLERGLPWYTPYYVMIGVACLEMAAGLTAFWAEDGRAYRKALGLREFAGKQEQTAAEKTAEGVAEKTAERVAGKTAGETAEKTAKEQTAEVQTAGTNEAPRGLRDALFAMPTARIAWVVLPYYLFYGAVEVAVAGWIPTFMLRARDAPAFAASMSALGFNLGITVGRFTLGGVADRLGLWRASMGFIVLCVAMHLLFWLAPGSYVLTASLVALEGLFLGPLFPVGITHITRIVDRRLHGPFITIAVTMGRSGAAIFPFAVGAAAQSRGIRVMPPLVLGFLGMVLLTCGLIPRKKPARKVATPDEERGKK